MFERFGNGRNIEIIINDELLKMLIELQNQFTKLKEMDNDKYKGEDIELPRPTPEEWWDCGAVIAGGECKNITNYIISYIKCIMMIYN